MAIERYGRRTRSFLTVVYLLTLLLLYSVTNDGR
jgi:hypothetical protein